MLTRQDAASPTIDKLILTTVTGDEIDVFNQFLSLTIYEDMFSPVLTGTITLLDNLGLFFKMPICGEEKITIRFYSYNYDPSNLDMNFFHRTFDVIKVSDVSQDNDYSVKYTLHFASPEFKKNQQIKISKAYPQTTISNVIATLMTEDFDVDEPLGLSFPTETMAQPIVRSPFLSDSDIEVNYQRNDDYDKVELFIEKTKFVEPWVTVPYMKPFEIIHWLSSRALRSCPGRVQTKTDSESVNFLFFENKRGFQFTSIDTLLENKEVIKSIFMMGSAAQNQNIGSERFPYENRITDLQILDSYDIVNNIQAGLYASTLNTYDFITGEVGTKEYDYLDSFISTESSERGKDGPPIAIWPGVEDYPFIGLDSAGKNKMTKKPLSRRFLLPFLGGRLNNEITSEQTQRNCATRMDIGPEAYVQKRSSQLARWTNFRILVQCPGNSVNKVGDCVTVDLKELGYPDDNYSNFKEKSSKYYSGHYLITAIKHSLDKTTYIQTIEMAKDSYSAMIGPTKENEQ